MLNRFLHKMTILVILIFFLEFLIIDTLMLMYRYCPIRVEYVVGQVMVHYSTGVSFIFLTVNLFRYPTLIEQYLYLSISRKVRMYSSRQRFCFTRRKVCKYIHVQV